MGGWKSAGCWQSFLLLFSFHQLISFLKLEIFEFLCKKLQCRFLLSVTHEEVDCVKAGVSEKMLVMTGIRDQQSSPLMSVYYQQGCLSA